MARVIRDPRRFQHAANVGMRRAFHRAELERAEAERMRVIAGGIYTEELLQQVLEDVDPAMRDAVERMIRPLTKIPSPEITP